MPRRSKIVTCTTHHHACDCREAEFAARDARMQALERVEAAAKRIVESPEFDTAGPVLGNMLDELAEAIAARAEGEKG